jgi:hypothetical protein
MPVNQTSGNLTTDAFGGAAAVEPNYIESVFSTYLYTGTGATQSIVNGIDLSTKGGLVWIKSRSAATDHKLTDTARGATKALISDTDGAQTTDTTGLTAFGTTGFTIGADSNYNTSAATYASWTFRKQPKFFDVVTYTGTGSNTTIAHSLGSVPGCIMVKRTDTTGDWQVYHSSLANTEYLVLNTTAVKATGATRWNSTTPTSTVFSVGTDATVNASGGTYVAYLFAHNAGGFGLTGTDNVISCGSFTTDGSGNATVSLGYEPQWVIQKATDAAYGWWMNDSMRGMPVSGYTAQLNAEAAYAESLTSSLGVRPNATGFTVANGVNTKTFIYIAIRRGPMKVPTDATKVFSPNSVTTGSASVTFTPNFVVDFNIGKEQGSSGTPPTAITRLAGSSSLNTSDTSAESSNGNIRFDSNISVQSIVYNSSVLEIGWSWRRAPSFFDEVCYTGNYASQTLTHNLGAVPEMFILKNRASGSDGNWIVYHAAVGNTAALQLNLTATPSASNAYFNSTSPTSTTFTIGTNQSTGGGATYVAYLFATCAGVSKVGSYTGNGTTQTINCGFTGGARFVLIKRTDSAGDWYVYDTARGMTTLTDPYLLLNLQNSQVSTLGSVTTVSTGFALNATILAAINTSSATYIFLAIA